MTNVTFAKGIFVRAVKMENGTIAKTRYHTISKDIREFRYLKFLFSRALCYLLSENIDFSCALRVRISRNDRLQLSSEVESEYNVGIVILDSAAV
jgi:hypothetical protein